MDGLPVELVALILRKVVTRGESKTPYWRIAQDWMNCRLVCKGWNVIASDRSLVPCPESRMTLFANARLAQETELYEDMTKIMRRRAEYCVEFNVDEIKLLTEAYRDLLGNIRGALRIVMAEGQRISSTVNQGAGLPPEVECILKVVKVYESKLESEIILRATEAIDLIEEYVLPYATQPEALIKLIKMQADLCRYIGELRSNKELVRQHIERAEMLYDRAAEMAEAKLRPANATRLSVALNRSVFYYEIRNNGAKSNLVRLKAFDDALSDLDNLTEEEYRECSLLMQLLRDSLTLWTLDDAEDDEGNE